MHVELSRRARRDIQGIDRQARRHIVDVLLHVDAPNSDVKSLAGRSPWRRLRAGSYRVIFRTLGVEELAALGVTDAQGVLVARVVHRRELERAIASLA